MTSRRIWVALATLLLATACRPPGPGGDAPGPEARPVRVVALSQLTYGVSTFTNEDVASAAESLRLYLQQKLAIPVRLRVAEPYRELPALLEAGAVDVAQIAPLAYVRLRDARRVRGLATMIVGGNPTYLGHLYVREDAPLRRLEDLRGRRVAYVSHESTSGYLFPRALFESRGIDPDRFFGEVRFYGSHSAVAEAVLSGAADAGAAFDFASDWASMQLATERPAGLRVLAKTARIPNDCAAARSGLDEGTAGAIQAALLAARPGAGMAGPTLSGLRVNGWVQLDERRYDRVRDVLAREAGRRAR
jgi:phosphonate transport system substrate-binding protein